MANIWERIVSILVGNLNLACSHIITTVTLKNYTNVISDLTIQILLQPVTNKWSCCSNADFKQLHDQWQPNFCLEACSGNPPITTPTPTPTPTPVIPDYCSCAIMWIDGTVDFLELSASVRPKKLAKKIIQKWDAFLVFDGCFDVADLQNMFCVSHRVLQKCKKFHMSKSATFSGRFWIFG